MYIKVKYYWVFCIIKKQISGYDIRMLEIIIADCYKCDLETIDDPIILNVFGLIEEI